MADIKTPTALSLSMEALLASITPNGGAVELHFDVESASLRGVGFAYGGFIRQGGEVLATFALLSTEGAAGACDWVRDNVIPHLGDVPTIETQEELISSFWEIYAGVRARVIDVQGIKPWETTALRRAFAVVFDNGWPVEASFLLAAHDWARENAGAGEFDGPYMPVDVQTGLAALGYNPDLPRGEAAAALGVTGPQHDPRVDAAQSAAIWDAALRGDPKLDRYKVQ